MSAIIRMEDIKKQFAGVRANDHINLQIEEGEVHCLLGENGAGKSTLMKILYGLYSCDEGKIFVRDKEVNLHGPSDAIAEGIAMVHQHFMLIPVFTVAENLILGSEPVKGGFLDIDTAKKELIELSQQFSLYIDPDAYIQDISVGMQQRVEILKMLYRGAEIMIFDEPTAVLTPQEVKELYKIMRLLKEKGKTLIFITHKLREVMEISDRVTILRDGRVVDTLRTETTNSKELAKMMVGREVLFSIDRPENKAGKEILKVEDIYAEDQRGLPAINGLSFNVREGEIVGIAGIDGNGQTELVEVLTGLRGCNAGRIVLNGSDLTKKKPKSFLKAGIAHVPEDRFKRGIIADFTLFENMLLGYQDETLFANGMFVKFKELKSWTHKILKIFDVRFPTIEVNISVLSGGNQQKLVIAREFQRDPKLLIVAQPTRGLDVGATEFMQNQIMKIRSEGKAVLLVSLDLNEIMSLSDRILVIYKGQFQGEFSANEADESEIGFLMAGGRS